MNSVYYFTNYKGEIIYVGKTKNIKKRMNEHFLHGHLPKDCYESVDHVFYADVGASKYDAEIIETIFINKYKPKYNTEKKYPENYNISSYKAPNVQWKEIFITYTNNTVNVSFLKPKYKCFDTKLTPKERVDSIIEHNILLIKHKPKIIKHYLKQNAQFTNELLDALKDFLSKLETLPDVSSYDEPLFDEENNAAYASFYINNENNELINSFLKLHLISKLTDEIYFVPLYNKGTLENIEYETISI